MRIGLVAHPGKPRALELARRSVERLTGRAELMVTPGLERPGPDPVPVVPLEAMTGEALLAFGGDGTFLRALHRSRLPLLPINAGTLGFLSEIDGDRPERLEAALDRLLDGRYHRESRMRLAVRGADIDLPDAINEVVVHSRSLGKMLLFEIAIDGQAVGRVRADGMVLATPTGSSAYALSALGPIVDPALDGIVVVSLAPFRAPPRAVVIDPLREVAIRLVHPERDGVVIVDGQTELALPAGREIRIGRSPRRAEFLRLGDQYFRRLAEARILPWTEPVDGRP